MQWQVVVNGEERVVPQGLSVSGLIEHLGLDPRLIVVERNREILERQRLDEVRVEPGDRFEVVHFVGGG